MKRWYPSSNYIIRDQKMGMSFLARQPPPWKSQIAHLDMHNFVFGINFQIHSVSLTIHVSIHLLIHFSAHLFHHPRSCHPSLHSLFYSRLKTYVFNKSSFPTLDFFYLLDCLTITGLGRTYHAHHFIFSFTYLIFLFIPCGRLSWLPTGFLLHIHTTVRYNCLDGKSIHFLCY